MIAVLEKKERTTVGSDYINDDFEFLLIFLYTHSREVGDNVHI
jgi:hypothetical protein